MIVSASYFTYDFLACLYYNLADGGLVAHHSLAICGYGVAVLAKYGGTSSISKFFIEANFLSGFALC